MAYAWNRVMYSSAVDVKNSEGRRYDRIAIGTSTYSNDVELKRYYGEAYYYSSTMTSKSFSSLGTGRFKLEGRAIVEGKTYSNSKYFTVNSLDDFNNGTLVLYDGVKVSNDKAYSVYAYLYKEEYIPEPPSSVSSINVPSYVTEGSNINISWSSSSKATKYRLEQKVDNGSWSLVETTSGLSSSVRAGYTWDKVEFRVRAENSDGNSSWTYSSTVTIRHPQPPRPPSSISINVDEIKSGQPFEVSWTRGTYASQYRLERRINNESWSQIYSGSLLSKEQTATDSWNTVQYRVRSYNSDGYSSYRTSEIYTVKHFPDLYINVDNNIIKVNKGWVKVDDKLCNISNIYIKIDNNVIKS